MKPNGYTLVKDRYYYHRGIYFARNWKKKIRAAGLFDFIVEGGYFKNF